MFYVVQDCGGHLVAHEVIALGHEGLEGAGVLQAAKFRGEKWSTLCDGVVRNLPKQVYVSVDIDGFDPKLCPDTGTPVPGGLDYNEFVELLRALLRAKKQVVGFDINEVAPSRLTKPADWGADWNANVGSRVLYKLIGAAAKSR